MRRKEQIDRIARDCVHFKGDRPCQPHKRAAAMCRCQAYCPQSSKVLFIELSSRCAVIRSSAILHRLKEDDPNIHITYLTAFPELLSSVVDEPLPFDAAAVLRVQMDQFNTAYNLDIAPKACAIMNVVNAEEMRGFYLRQGNPMPINDAAESMYLAKITPNSCSKNQPDQIRQLFQLCSLEYRRERPRLTRSAKTCEKVSTPHTIALNNANPDQWGKDNWTNLTQMLTTLSQTVPILTDNNSEHNTESVIETISNCDIFVGSADWQIELAWAMGKEIVLLQNNNQDTDAEISYFGTRCCTVEPNAEFSDDSSIRDIDPDQVFQTVMTHLNQKPADGFTGVEMQLTQKTNRPKTNKRIY